MLIIIFTYFYTAVQFNPVDQADNLRKYGGYIPGIRPGPPTAQYLDRVLTRLTLPGALYLATVAVLPSIFIRYGGFSQATSRALGGTSVLIVVGVALDTMRQMESQMMMRSYEGFLNSLALNVLLWARRAPARAPRRSGSPPSTASRTSRPATCSARRSPPARRSAARSKPIYDAGDLVPDELTIALDPRAACAPTTPPAASSSTGFRARSPQAEALDAMLEEIERPLDVVFEFQLPDEVAIERLRGRAQRKAAPTTRPRRSQSGSRIYHEQTEPLVEHYRAAGSSSGSTPTAVEEVCAEVQRRSSRRPQMIIRKSAQRDRADGPRRARSSRRRSRFWASTPGPA